MVREAARTYLVVKSARASSFSAEDTCGRENTGKRNPAFSELSSKQAAFRKINNATQDVLP